MLHYEWTSRGCYRPGSSQGSTAFSWRVFHRDLEHLGKLLRCLRVRSTLSLCSTLMLQPFTFLFPPPPPLLHMHADRRFLWDYFGLGLIWRRFTEPQSKRSSCFKIAVQRCLRPNEQHHLVVHAIQQVCFVLCSCVLRASWFCVLSEKCVWWETLAVPSSMSLQLMTFQLQCTSFKKQIRRLHCHHCHLQQPHRHRHQKISKTKMLLLLFHRLTMLHATCFLWLSHWSEMPLVSHRRSGLFGLMMKIEYSFIATHLNVLAYLHLGLTWKNLCSLPFVLINVLWGKHLQRFHLQCSQLRALWIFFVFSLNTSCLR